jgi:CheY-like chemotaxis protein
MGRTAPEARRRSIPRLSRRVRALIVDDHDGFADSLALLLGRMGAETLCAYSGADGIDKARMWHPDAMLVDLGLPDMTGFEVAQRVRSWAGAEEVLLIAVTGFAERGSGRTARCAGFDGSLVKPIDIDRMHALLEQKGPPGASAAREPGAHPDRRAEAPACDGDVGFSGRLLAAGRSRGPSSRTATRAR